ncbi:MAG: RNA polymerase factor sigma-54 [Burkholderiaceae bacterium]
MVLTTSRQTIMSRQMQRALAQLQMSALELTQEISRVIEVNPLLECDALGSDALDCVDDTATSEEDESAPEPRDDPPEPLEWGAANKPVSSEDDAGDWVANIASQDGLREHLQLQLLELSLSADERGLVAALIDSLDDRGYLADSLETVAGALNLTSDHSGLLDKALGILQAMSPAGVGARDLRECLQLQLDRIASDEPGWWLARKVVDEHLDHLGGQNRRNLPSTLDVSPQEIDQALTLIRSLEPRPGRAFDESRVDYVVPDLELMKIRGQWRVKATRAILPRLQINEAYAAAIGGDRESDHRALGEKLREARWLIRSIEQRASTIERVGEAIVDRQSRFFDHGDIGLKPMTLAEIADAVGVHESTVSRVVNNKYMATPGGLVPLRRFFGSSVSTTAGRACSAAAVKAMILQMVEKEVPGEPLTDHQLTDLLARKGVRIARRTVSKYRYAIGVEPYEMRRLSAAPREPDVSTAGTRIAK